MKIVILGTRGFPNVQGGVERHCEYLAINLVKLGCEVIVITRTPYVNKWLKFYKGVKLVPIPTIKHKGLETFLHTLVGVFAAVKYRPDILQIHAIGPALFTPLAKMLRMKVVVTSHGSNYKHLKWGKFAKFVLKIGERSGVMFADQVIAVSKGIAQEIYSKYKRLAVQIPNGFTPQNGILSTEVLGNFGLDKRRYILSVGRIVPEKGFDVLINAYQMLNMPSYKLVIAGEADHEDDYSLFIKKCANQSNKIVLTGYLNAKEIAALYYNAKIFVLPSYYEGFPIVLLEAMGYGLSSIASDIMGNRYVKLDENRFFKPGDCKQLATKIKYFIENPITNEEKKQQMKIIHKKYDWENIAKRTFDVYVKVLRSNVKNLRPKRL